MFHHHLKIITNYLMDLLNFKNWPSLLFTNFRTLSLPKLGHNFNFYLIAVLPVALSAKKSEWYVCFCMWCEWYVFCVWVWATLLKQTCFCICQIQKQTSNAGGPHRLSSPALIPPHLLHQKTFVELGWMHRSIDRFFDVHFPKQKLGEIETYKWN